MFTTFFYTLRIILSLVAFTVSLSASIINRYDIASYLIGFAVFALLIGDYIGPMPGSCDDEDDDHEKRV